MPRKSTTPVSTIEVPVSDIFEAIRESAPVVEVTPIEPVSVVLPAKRGRKVLTRTVRCTGNVTVVSSGKFNGVTLVTQMSLSAIDADDKPFEVTFASSAQMRAVAEAILAAL